MGAASARCRSCASVQPHSEMPVVRSIAEAEGASETDSTESVPVVARRGGCVSVPWHGRVQLVQASGCVSALAAVLPVHGASVGTCGFLCCSVLVSAPSVVAAWYV